MRLCYFASEYPAVSHTFIRREIAELERNGFDVLRVSLRQKKKQLVDPVDLEESDRTRYILNQGVLTIIFALLAALARPMMVLKASASAVKMMKRSYRPRVLHLAYLAEALVLARWALEHQVRHIHAHFGTNGAEVAMLAHLLTGIPFSFTVHGPDEFDKPEFIGLAENVRRAAFVRAISSFTGSQLCRWIPVAEWRKIKVVRCGLDAEFTTSPGPMKLASHEFISIGRLSAQKGQFILLQALAALAEEGVPFKMTLVGEGPLRFELERCVRAFGLEGRVEMTGALSNAEVRARILDARALVLPSFAEGLPVVLMEALALGRPVITTYVAGIPELVSEGVCGWLVPAGDARRLSRAIKDCLKAPDAQILAMGQAGRARVLEMHDVVRECEKLGDLFREYGAPLPEHARALGQPAPSPLGSFRRERRNARPPVRWRAEPPAELQER